MAFDLNAGPKQIVSKLICQTNFENRRHSYTGCCCDGEVVSGLNQGDNIVAEGLKKVRPRGKIKPIKK